VTHAFFVPTMFQRLLDLPEGLRSRCDTTSLRHAIHGAAPCPPHVKRAMIDWWGPVIDELYGGTESIGQTFISSEEWLRHPGSVGRPSGQVEVKIVDTDGNRLPPGACGLVKMRNPQRFEYHGAAAAGAGQAYDAEGFASLGDIGYLDADGYLYLTDRESNMIISGGVNIYPQEAEALLLAHPDVADVAVIGVPDRDLGEAAKALVVLQSGCKARAETAAGILAFCGEQLSRYKCPRSLDFVSGVPRNELGKLVKREIPEELRSGPGSFTAGCGRDP
jgi:acyl-CoA synthetase (AMP-forming)/AMP-acid ligase II